MQRFHFLACLVVGLTVFQSSWGNAFLKKHCVQCHDADTKEGNLDLTTLPERISNQETFARWVKIYDRVQSGEMPPKDVEQPTKAQRLAFLQPLKQSLIQVEKKIFATDRTRLRRLTRVEYENTMRDLFGMRFMLQDRLPGDGKVHGFDKNSDALSISHVHMSKYLQTADYILDLAIATQPKAPTKQKFRLSLAMDGGITHLASNAGGAVFLKDKKPHPDHPPLDGKHQHIDRGAHKMMGMYDDVTVGVFRHEDESFAPRFQAFSAVYPGKYRVKTSLWSYTWDKGTVKASRGTEAARFTVVQLQGNGRGGGHPSYLIGYFDAPSIDSKQHEFHTWLNPKDCLGFNVSSLAPVHIYHQYKRNQLAFTGPGIACDYVEIEGPIHTAWPPKSHQVLFGKLPLVEVEKGAKDKTYPLRVPPRQRITGARNKQDPWQGLWTVQSDDPVKDARELLRAFLPKAFRRPIEDQVLDAYVAQVKRRMEAGDCFELAMRWVYRAALCSPDFLFHIEPAGKLDQYALANRLSYLLWNSMPDETLTQLAAQGQLKKPAVLQSQTERMLKDQRAERFVKDFCGQWLRLEEVTVSDPDKKLYPEFSTYLQTCMLMESEAYFKELLHKDLSVTHLIDSDFVMINQKLAKHYGIDGVVGSKIRRVALPANSPRGGFLAQASILKITANGTTTSPVPRGAFVTERLLGKPVDPPPPNVPAIEPDVRGAVTIRDQLEKHRSDQACAGCHAKLDPAGFALESFDPIGGYRERYRSMKGDKPQRGTIDPFIPMHFRLGRDVDPSYQLEDGQKFSNLKELKQILIKDRKSLAANMARHLTIYATGRELRFSDRDPIDSMVEKAKTGGVRSILHQVIQSEVFQTR